MKKQNYDVIVVGGGASGCMAALTAAEHGARVLLLERNAKIGRKLYITGKGRCNVTNCCDTETCLANIPHNGRFLYSALSRFTPSDTMRLFEALGVPLKVERGNRVFPQSDRAADVIDALLHALRKAGVTILEERAISLELSQNTICGVKGEKGTYHAKAVILATGGVSYPATGSTGDGHQMAQTVGHTLQPCRGSLVPLKASDCTTMQGLSLRNVALKITDQKGKSIYREQGEMLFTHFGMSGPLVLSASAHMRDFEHNSYTAWIDLKPALDADTLDHRLIRELSEGSNKDLKHILETLEPKSLIPLILERADLRENLKGNTVTKQQRRRLTETLKGLRFPIIGPRPVEEAIVTAGGITVKEVSPKTMSSKLCNGLFLVGELLDVDAYTGGFNLQIAWATGHLAGLSAAEFCLGLEESENDTKL